MPSDAARVLVLGEVAVELPGRDVTRISNSELDRIAQGATGNGSVEDAFDAAVLEGTDDGFLPSIDILARLLRPGGLVVGTAPAARNQRQIEEFVDLALSHGTHANWQPTGGITRRQLLTELPAAGLDVRWIRVVRDGWLDPLALRPDGGGTVVESQHFLLRSVPAEVAEELTADQIVFAASRQLETDGSSCSIVLATLAGSNPERFADALRETAPHDSYELVVVHSDPDARPVAGATPVAMDEEATLAMRWNAGARAASAELLVFASADSVPLPGWLDALLQAHRSRPDTGAAGSKVIAEDGTVEHSGLVLGSGRIPYRLYQGDAATAPHVNRHRIMPAVAADGMVTARARFVEVGGFDETLGDDLTDADLCMRLRARGLPIVYCPAAVLHSQPRSTSRMRALWRSSAREFAARWGPTTLRSDELICQADGRDLSAEINRSWRLPAPFGAGVGVCQPSSGPAISGSTAATPKRRLRQLRLSTTLGWMSSPIPCGGTDRLRRCRHKKPNGWRPSSSATCLPLRARAPYRRPAFQASSGRAAQRWADDVRDGWVARTMAGPVQRHGRGLGSLGAQPPYVRERRRGGVEAAQGARDIRRRALRSGRSAPAGEGSRGFRVPLNLLVDRAKGLGPSPAGVV